MKMEDVYPTKYLSASDLGGRPATVRIDRVDLEKLDGADKPIVYFVGKKKGLACNKTNFKKIASITGQDDSDHWRDEVIELFEAEVDYQGDTVPAIRVRAPRTETRAPERSAPQREAPRERAHEPDRISSGLDRGHDREVDDAPRDPPPQRQAAGEHLRSRDMDDDIPFMAEFR